MNLSVVIVTYRVLPFLEQCLSALELALGDTNAEIIVVNNQGGDASDDLIQQRFSNIQLISLPENLGFAKACNIGWRKSKGKHILFLNPDTLITSRSIQASIELLEQNERNGAVGVRMIDGSGRFLPESKRSFPTIQSAFFKLFGLANLFKHSNTFNAYATPHIEEKSIHEVEVLAGAFMVVKKKVLEQVNGFDESYFMYGEDIDLCKKITDAGYHLLYLGEATILHFKGESSRKMGWLHIKRFYNAMLQFIGNNEKSNLKRWLLSCAIFLRACLAFIVQIISKLRAPLSDALLWIGCLFISAVFWEDFIKEYPFPPWTILVTDAMLVFAMLLFQFLFGTYNRHASKGKQITNSLLILILILATYSLLPEHLRYSRGVILLSILLYSPLRILLSQLWQRFGWIKAEHPCFNSNSYIVCPSIYQKNVFSLLAQLGVIDVSVPISDQTPKENKTYHHIIWIISKDSTFEEVLESIQRFPKSTHWWHVAGSHGLVSSKKKQSTGSFLIPGKKSALAQPYQQNMKRLIDLLVCFLLIPQALLNQPIRKAILLCFNNKATLLGIRDLYLHTGIDKKVLIAYEACFPNASFPLEQLYLHQYDWLREFNILLKHYFRISQLLENSRELH